MIAPECLTKSWISAEAKRQDTPPEVLEKCIYALLLVGKLRAAGLNFVFKGGTSLILHLDPIRRLSIDVDISSNEPRERVEDVLNIIKDGDPFLGWSYQDWRDSENPPTKYFKVTYGSPVLGKEGSIQLDVLVMEAGYEQVEERRIAPSFLTTTMEATVLLPSVDCLLGDKLTAFAPSTIGIQYEPVSRRTGEPTEPQPIRVMKQLFDIGELYLLANDLPLVARTYTAHHAKQNAYRGGGISLEAALQDSLDAAYNLAMLDLLSKDNESDRTAFFRKGVKALNTHLIGAKLTPITAKTAAGRAALLAMHILAGRTDVQFDDLRAIPTDPNQLRDLRIEGRWSPLQRLRNTNPEAFYLWYRAHLLDRGV
jgi:hypothetical protein